MKKYKRIFNICLVLLITLALATAINAESEKGRKSQSPAGSLAKTAESGKNGDAYALNVNNVWIPLNNRGVIADVNINEEKDAVFAGHNFLFSGGFFLSGYANGQLWANASASASLVENYVPGTVEGGQADPNAVMYVLNVGDEPFGDSWQDWKDAVSLGADFYDGNGDGEYTPVDLNGNGNWDPDEDKPDLLGDETVWCVYNDGQPLAQRTRYAGVKPMGIEVRQTVFAFASKGAIGNIIFIRYRIKNTGLITDTLKNVYFGAWADPDLGDHMDDLVGVDTSLNAGFVYQTTEDGEYGPNPPCFMIDFFSGPKAYLPGVSFTDVNGNGRYDEGTDVAVDTAFSVRGQTLGINQYPGATNLGVSSFVHYQQSDPDLGDPDTHFEARNYMLGFDKAGNELDPCDWALGNNPPGCESIDNRFWYSGDPVTSTGWLNTNATDQRQMQNTGPFELVRDQELEIVVAYIVGQGTDPLNSVTEARRISEGAQFVFDNNFQSPSPGPPIVPSVETGDDFIDLIWKSHEQLSYVNTTEQYDLGFEGFRVTAYKTNTTEDLVELQTNSTEIALFDLDDYILNLYQQTGQGGFDLVFPQTENPMDPEVYADEDKGVLRLRIRQDPFTSERLVKGKPYYFAITGFYYNKLALRYKPVPENLDSIGREGDYFLSSQSLVGVSENVPKITEVVLGENLYDPPIDLYEAEQSGGFADATVEIDVYNKEELTGDEYKVSFMIDSTSATYATMWNLENTTTGTVLLDSMTRYLVGAEEIAIPEMQTEGFLLRLSNETPAVNPVEYDTQSEWYDTDWSASYFVSATLAGATKPNDISSVQQSTYFSADKLRRVELRFDGTGGKAYRYLNGYIKTSILPATRKFTYKYAEMITSADTTNLGSVGSWNAADDHAEGFVDVPFTAWVEDTKYGETRQLAVGFIEAAEVDGGNPDGVWDPGTSLADSKEYIVIFDTDYDPEGNNAPALKGGTYVDTDADWADLRGYTLNPALTIDDEDIKIAKSPYFNAIYVVGLQKATENSEPAVGDRLIFSVANYPYTPADEFTFTTKEGGMLSGDEEKSLFDKVNVYPNPLFGYNVATSYDNSAADEPFVTFSNLPEEITIKIYSLSGTHLRTLTEADKSSPTSPFLRWNLQNESGLRVASGMYLAIVSSPKYGDKVLKFAIVMPQKQIPKY